MDTTGRQYSKKPLPKIRAEKQLKALHIHTGHGLYGGADDGDDAEIAGLMAGLNVQEPVEFVPVAAQHHFPVGMFEPPPRPRIRRVAPKRAISTVQGTHIVSASKRQKLDGQGRRKRGSGIIQSGLQALGVLGPPALTQAQIAQVQNTLANELFNFVAQGNEPNEVAKQAILELCLREAGLHTNITDEERNVIMNEATQRVQQRLIAVRQQEEADIQQQVQQAQQQAQQLQAEAKALQLHDNAQKAQQKAQQRAQRIQKQHGKFGRGLCGGRLSETWPMLKNHLDELTTQIEFQQLPSYTVKKKYLEEQLDGVIQEMNTLFDEPDELSTLVSRASSHIKNILKGQFTSDVEQQQLVKEGLSEVARKPIGKIIGNVSATDTTPFFKRLSPEQHPSISGNTFNPIDTRHYYNPQALENVRYTTEVDPELPQHSLSQTLQTLLRINQRTGEYYDELVKQGIAAMTPAEVKARDEKLKKGKGKYTEPDQHILIGDYLSGSGYYQDELQRRLSRFPEHIAKIITEKTLPLLKEVGPSTGFFSKNPERQERKQTIVDDAIAQAEALVQQRATRSIVKTGEDLESAYDYEPIEEGTTLVDYNDNDYKHGRYIGQPFWNEMTRRGRTEHPETREEINPRNVETYTAKLVPKTVKYNKYRQGEDTWYTLADETYNPVGESMWKKPELVPGQTARRRNTIVVPTGEGKYKFIKKYLKGQGIPATKKNVAKICNIMDVEGVVFE